MSAVQLIADAGATKTDWVLASEGKEISRVRTQGINPVVASEQTICEILVKELKPNLQVQPDAVYFYGAGCIPSKCGLMENLLRENLLSFHSDTIVEVKSDLFAAARALCGHEQGIACILGTGANSCFYDGEKIVKNTPPLGYILGDEGSGAVMGKHFVANVLKGFWSAEICRDFFEETHTSYDEIIDRVYHQPQANRYLAAFRPVVERHRSVPEVHDFLIHHFCRFIERNVKAYAHPELPLHFIGGIAYTFRKELEEAAHIEGYEIGKTELSPISGLLVYHQS